MGVRRPDDNRVALEGPAGGGTYVLAKGGHGPHHADGVFYIAAGDFRVSSLAPARVEPPRAAAGPVQVGGGCAPLAGAAIGAGGGRIVTRLGAKAPGGAPMPPGGLCAEKGPAPNLACRSVSGPDS